MVVVVVAVTGFVAGKGGSGGMGPPMMIVERDSTLKATRGDGAGAKESVAGAPSREEGPSMA